jgi:hypothetical protein
MFLLEIPNSVDEILLGTVGAVVESENMNRF